MSLALLHEPMPPSGAEHLTPEQVANAMEPIYRRGDRLTTRFVLGHAVLTVALAPIYQTWAVSLIWGTITVAAWFLTLRLGPGAFRTRAMSGVVLESFCALHIWQMHGQPEQHFWFFVGFTMMIVYQDWLCMWPGALLIIIQHTAFAGLHNQGMNLHFFPEPKVDFIKLLFHFGIAIVHVAVCGYWALLLKRQTLKDTAHTVELGRDLAERHRAEAALRSSQQGLRLALDAARMAGWELDPSSRTLVFSTNAESIFGTGEGAVPARLEQLLDRVHPLDRAGVARWFEDAAGPGEERRVEYRLLEPDGSVRWILLRGQRVRDGDEAPRIVGVLSDLTDRRQEEHRHRQLELKVQHAQKLESLGVLAGGVAHDFNNLLVAILGNAGLARQSIPEHNPASEPVREIEAAAHRAADLTRQMLAYSGRGKFVLERVSLRGRIAEMNKLLSSMIAKKTELHFDLGDAPPVMADPSQIDQVIMNLVTNASEALGDDGGSVTIRTGVVQVDRTYRDFLEHGEDLALGTYSYLEVEDGGLGMDQATVARIFDPFFTTKFTGRGLGLAAVLGIVRGHQGGIRVETAPGKGSRFTALFPSAGPVAEQPAAAPRRERPSGMAWRASGLVLVIDDEPAVRRLATRVLESRGFEVRCAEDGLQGLRLFEECQSRTSLVLLDWTMPGLSGEEVLVGIHQQRPDMPVLISSGYAENDLADRLPEPGPAGFVPKPYRNEELIEAVKRALTWGPVSA